MQEVEAVEGREEHMVSEWAPIHLERLLRQWYWKDEVNEVRAADVWRDIQSYLYMPRLRNEEVFTRYIAKGGDTQEHFGFAHEKTSEGYRGFAFEHGRPDARQLVVVDRAPQAALAFQQEQAAQPIHRRLQRTGQGNRPRLLRWQCPRPQAPTWRFHPSAPERPKTRYFGTLNLDYTTASSSSANSWMRC